MRHKIHVTDGSAQSAEPPADTAAAQDAEATGTNAPPVNDSVQDTPDAVDGAASTAGNAGSSQGAAADPTAGAQRELASLREENERLRRELEQAKDQSLRSMADFQNFRRRKEEEGRLDRQFANRELILALLPVLDNFERALSAAEKTESYDALVSGVKLTLRQLQDFLAKNGVSAIEAVGQEFDPNLHEAVMRVEDGDHPENSVVEELQRGYTMHDRVLRPSMVKVARSG